MSENKNRTKSYIDRDSLPQFYPTHRHQAQFWEQLGRTIATFGFLEEILGRAIFAFTATRLYTRDEAEQAYKKWLPKLERALSDQLWNLAESYAKAVRDNQDATVDDLDELVGDIKSAAKIRNVLCHGSWGIPDDEGKSLPFFVNRSNEIFDTKIDVEFLKQVQVAVVDLVCSVMDSVTLMGWEFPGSRGPGKKIWEK